jgi:hypothetical protein
LLLDLISAVILRPKSRGTHEHIVLSQIQDSANLERQVPVFISPRNVVVRLYPRHWVLFSLPPTTSRATVEVFDPASIRDDLIACSDYVLGTSNTKITVSIVDEACLPFRCLAIDVLLFHAFASAGMCLESRFLAMGRHVTLCSGTFNFSYSHP